MSPPEVLSITNPQAIVKAKSVIQSHGLIAFPTDTVYGLAADVFSLVGIQKIYLAKQRPEEKALPILIGDLSQLETLVLPISDEVQRIAQVFWPGALTLVLLKGPQIPPELSPYATVGIRMPNLDFTRQLLRQTGPLATTSANISGGSNPTSAQDVIDQLGGQVDLILDGGETPGPAASTVIDATSTELQLLRAGPISLEEIKSIFKVE